MTTLQHVQDQATALSHSVQDLQQQLQSLQLPDQIQNELQPIQDDVQRTSHNLNRLVCPQQTIGCCMQRIWPADALHAN